MKKTWVTVVNVIIMIAMLTFVVLYSNFENKNTTQRQINENASAIGSESILFVGSKLRQVWHSMVQNCTAFKRKKSFFTSSTDKEPAELSLQVLLLSECYCEYIIKDY